MAHDHENQAPTAAPDNDSSRDQNGDVQSVAFVSLGCPKNLVDSEKMLGLLAQDGLKLVSDHDEADAIVVNTCGFLEASKDESLSVIKEAIERKENGSLKRVIVAGCLVQRHRARMLEWAPGIDSMIGVFDRDHIIDAVRGTQAERTKLDDQETPRYWIAGNALQAAKERGMDTVGLTVKGADGKGIGYFEDDSARMRLTPRHWAYLRVSEGCNQKCAFCTIPSIRGKMRSKPLDDIVTEARQLMADGTFELNLIGQDTTSFGYDIGDERGLSGMLTALNDVAAEYGQGWIRLMYVYPTYFTDEMIDVIASLEHVVNYIDIPLQHMSSPMLKAMRRNITAAEQETLLHKLRERIPGLAIRTTLITGFPGETEADHQANLDFIESFGFDMLGVFAYSREAGTPAGTMDLDPTLHVPDEIKAERERDIMLLQQEIAFDNAAYVAEQRCEFDVLIDGPAAAETTGLETSGVSSAGVLHAGRCYFQALQVDSMTYVHANEALAPGELVRCTVVDSDGYDLIARPTAQMDTIVSLPTIG